MELWFYYEKMFAVFSFGFGHYLCNTGDLPEVL